MENTKEKLSQFCHVPVTFGELCTVSLLITAVLNLDMLCISLFLGRLLIFSIFMMFLTFGTSLCYLGWVELHSSVSLDHENLNFFFFIGVDIYVVICFDGLACSPFTEPKCS